MPPLPRLGLLGGQAQSLHGCFTVSTPNGTSSLPVEAVGSPRMEYNTHVPLASLQPNQAHSSGLVLHVWCPPELSDGDGDELPWIGIVLPRLVDFVYAMPP